MKRKEQIEILEKMIYAYRCRQSNKELLAKYKWFSLASSIKDDELVKELMVEILQDAKGNI